MRIACVGAGPAGLTFGLLAAQHGHEVELFERRATPPSGFGVVLWPDHLDDLASRDSGLVDDLQARAAEWDGQVITIADSTPIRTAGHGFGIARSAVLAVLRDRAVASGASVSVGRAVQSAAELEGYDLVVAADGARSSMREGGSKRLGATVVAEQNRYAWFELARKDDTFRFPFVRSPSGWLWAHVYPYRAGACTFVVETTTRVWQAEGLDCPDQATVLDRVNALFARHLGGERLTPLTSSRTGMWEQFLRVTTERWTADRLVLMGDAAHTTHFSIGSGTRFAMEDAVALVDELNRHGRVADALAAYDLRRRTALRRPQRSAMQSAQFFEHLPRYIERPERDFVRLLEKRRSRLMHLVPPAAFLALSRTADSLRGRTSPY